jgi:hypothetical protein
MGTLLLTFRCRGGGMIVDVPLSTPTCASRVAGFLADVRVEQTFVNPYDKKIDASTSSRCRPRAAVSGWRCDVGARTIPAATSSAAPRRSASTRRRAAKGHVAALLTQERPNLFTQSVANLEPGARVVVRLRYVQTAGLRGGRLRAGVPDGRRAALRAPKGKPRAATAGRRRRGGDRRAERRRPRCCPQDSARRTTSASTRASTPACRSRASARRHTDIASTAGA